MTATNIITDPAIIAARDVFWAKGYGGTSMEDIVRATGHNRYALYTRYGNKRDLLLKSLDHFVAVRRDYLMALMADEAVPPLDKLERFYRFMLDQMAEQPNGCLMCNVMSEVAPEDPVVGDACGAHLAELRGVLTMVLQAAATDGSLRREITPALSADLIINHMYGLGISGKSGVSPTHLSALNARFFDLLRENPHQPVESQSAEPSSAYTV